MVAEKKLTALSAEASNGNWRRKQARDHNEYNISLVGVKAATKGVFSHDDRRVRVSLRCSQTKVKKIWARKCP